MSETEADKDLQDDLASRGQTKPKRRRRGLRSSIVTLEQLPLFADEQSLSEAVLGPGKYTYWRGVVTLLEGRGFPKIDGLMGGRYTRAVGAFFDREYRVHGETQISKPHQPARLGASHGAVDGPERLGSYQGRARKRKAKSDDPSPE